MIGYRIVAVVAVLMLGLGACGSPTETPPPDGTNGPPATDGPAPTATPGEPTGEPTAPSDDNGGVATATAFFVRGTADRIAVEPETHELESQTVGVARAAMELLVAGETRNPDLTTLAPAGTRVLDVNIRERVLIVDFSAEVRNGPGGSGTEAAFAQQLAHTAAQFETVDAVQVWVEGSPVDELWGHVDWSGPIEPDRFALSPIIIDTPQWGDEIPAGRITARGTSLTFEATLALRLIDPSGRAVEDTFTTAVQRDVDRRGPWEHTFSVSGTEPGEWTIEAEAPDASDGEGPPPFVTRVTFTVR